MSLETQSLKLAAAMEKMAYAGLSEKVQSCIKGVLLPAVL